MRRIAIALVLAGLLTSAPLAHASSDPLGSGTTKLRLQPSFLAFLKKDKVTLSATAPAKLKAGALSLPVAGGLIDPTTGKGQIETGGSLVFQSSRKKVPLRKLSVKTKHSPLIAKVGGSQLKVATSAQIDSVREGFGVGFSAKALKLTAKVAERLNKKLRPKAPFSQGQKLGTLVSKTQPLTTTILEAGRATLVFDPGFVAKLSSLFVSLNPIFPAEHQGPTFTFPIIAGGQLAPNGSQGTLRSGGEVEMLQLGAGQLLWHELWLDLGAKLDSAEADAEPSPPNPGKSGRIGVFDLAPTAVSSDPPARTISVSGAALTLSAQTAATLNQLFGAGKAVFAAGEAAGTVSFVAQGQ